MPTLTDWKSLIIATITLIIVLIACYICIQSYKTIHYEQFQGWTQYRPACSSQWLSERRNKCKGVTTGSMPSIEDNSPISQDPC